MITINSILLEEKRNSIPEEDKVGGFTESPYFTFWIDDNGDVKECLAIKYTTVSADVFRKIENDRVLKETEYQIV